jgi:hypothetical protein
MENSTLDEDTQEKGFGQRLLDSFDAALQSKKDIASSIWSSPAPRKILLYHGEGDCRSCGRYGTLRMVYVSENPAAAPAGGPWCDSCCDLWCDHNRGLGIKKPFAPAADPEVRTFSLNVQQPLEEEAVCYNPMTHLLTGNVKVSKQEIEACEDRRAMRWLVAAKLQGLGDALLAAMEKLAAEHVDG